jgi:hypothetical protein
MRIPLISGIITDNTAEFLTSYPRNLEVVPVDNKIASAQFRATSGAIPLSTGPGICRGAINWNDVVYAVFGTKLCSVAADGTATVLGDVGGSGPVTLDYSFDRLIIRSGTNLFYWSPTLGLIQVTDTDLGPVVDCLWIDGYTMTTDGNYVITTELNDPTSVLPLKYGSAEEDPGPITGLIKARDEAYVCKRYIIEVFDNVGGTGFPFSVIKEAMIPVGCVGAMAKCMFSDSFAFCGGARNEAIGIYIAGAGSANRISTRAIDDELAKVADPSQIVLEARTYREERRLLVHLPAKTLVFQLNASKALGQNVWYEAQSGRGNPYRLRYAVKAYGKFLVGDAQSGAIGELSDTVQTHFGEVAEWQFDVGPVYNAGKGGIINSLELMGLPGRAPYGSTGSIFLSITRDGQNFSTERALTAPATGQTRSRMVWRPRCNFRTWFGARFRGYGAFMPGFAALEAQLTGLNA